MKKLSYLSVLLLLTLLCASGAKANTLDPKIGLGGGGSCASLSEDSATQSYTLGSAELGCIVDFTNNIPGATLTSLTVTVNTPFTGALSCIIDLTQPGNGGVSPFSVATVSSANSCTFSGPPLFPDAVLPGGTYGLQFGYAGAFFQSSSLDITLSTVPEPASIVLLGAGLAALVAGRKKLRSKVAS